MKKGILTLISLVFIAIFAFGQDTIYKDSFVVNHPYKADFKSSFVVKVPPFG